MFLPIGDDNPNERPAYVHYCIMGVNVAAFIYTLGQGYDAERFLLAWGFVPAHFSLLTLFTSMYIHGGVGHIFGNMLFLSIVGDNVEDRLGHVGYFVFYHLAGAAACLAHAALTRHGAMPLVGASGAISGVMGAYAIFFPRAKIKIWYWLFFFLFGVAYVSAGWAVGLWFVEQLLLRAVLGEQGVSYDAHIGGIVFGVTTALVLRGFFLGKPDVVRRVVGLRAPEGRSRWRRASEEPQQTLRPVEFAQPAVTELETGIDDNEGLSRGLRAGDLQLAYRYFTRAAAVNPAALDETLAMRFAEALLTTGSYGPAVRVYELIAQHGPESVHAPEAAFRLGVILSRAFSDFDAARPWLAAAVRTHPSARQRQRAFDELKRIDAHLRRVIPFGRS
jgi:membrane associated rhomboid family serine protease